MHASTARLWSGGLPFPPSDDIGDDVISVASPLYSSGWRISSILKDLKFFFGELAMISVETNS